MKKVILYSLCLSLVVTSCVEHKVYKGVDVFNYSDFQYSENLDGRELVEYYIYENPRSIAVTDSLLLVLNSKAKEFVQVFDRFKGKYLGSFLQSGRAYNEVISNPRYIGTSSTLNKLWLLDPMQRKTLVYDLSQVTNPDNLSPLKAITTADMLDNIIILSSGKVMGTPWMLNNTDYRIGITDDSGNLISSFGQFPDTGEPRPEFGLSEIFRSQIVVNDDETKVMLFNRNTDLIELYNTNNGELVKAIHGPDHFLSIYKAEANRDQARIVTLDGETKRAYSDPIVRGGLIWVSYSGAFIENYDNSINRIMVFDWELNPVALYHLPHHIDCFDVDVENQKIYVMAQNPESFESELLIYNFGSNRDS